MRLVSAVLFVALTGSIAVAEEAKPADPKPEVTRKKVPYRVVKVLPETGQVLLFDKAKGAHVVAEVGQQLDGFTVDEIDDDEVTLLSDTGASVILTSPPPPRQGKRAAKKAPAPVDPYAEPGEADATTAAGKASGGRASGDKAPVDPYTEPEAPTVAGEGGVRVASAASPEMATGATATTGPAAPIVDAGPGELGDPYGDPAIAAFVDAVGASSKPNAKADPKAKGNTTAKPRTVSASPDAGSALGAAAAGAPAPTTTATGTAPTATGTAPTATGTAPTATGTNGPAPITPTATASASLPPGTAVLARAELDAALADFGKTARTFRASFTPDGLRLDSIAEGSILAKVGLRKGDIVTYVDGRPLRSLDDAASLYARAGTLKATTLQVARDGKNVTLKLAIQ